MKVLMHTHKRQGFTIVELAVVIVVIGILASLVMLGYGNWRKSIIVDAAKSDLSTALAAMESARNFGEDYPDTIPANIQTSSNVSLSGGARPGGVMFCIEAVGVQDPSIRYYVSHKQRSPAEGGCAPTSTVVLAGGSATVDMWSVSVSGVGRSGGLVVGQDGNVYLANGASSSKNAVLRVNPSSGQASAFSGSGVSGNVNGPASGVQFRGPSGIVQADNGDFYVTDLNNNAVRKLDASGAASTFAGVHQPNGITIDGAGNLYVVSANSSQCVVGATSSGHKVTKITPSGSASLFAGSTICGSVDGPSASAQFNDPSDIAVDSKGDLYVIESSCRVRKIDRSGTTVSTLAGTTACTSSPVDGPVATATFRELGGVAVDSRGNVFVADHSSIRVITTDGMVQTLAANSIGRPMSLAFDEDDNLWVSDLSTNLTRVTIP